MTTARKPRLTAKPTRKQLIAALHDARRIIESVRRNGPYIMQALHAKGLPDWPDVGFEPKAQRILAVLAAADATHPQQEQTR